MTDVAATPDSSSNDHHRYHRQSDSISASSTTGSEHSSSAPSTTTVTTAASHQHPERPVSRPVMATASSSRTPLPHDGLSVSARYDYHSAHNFQQNGADHRELARRPTPLMNPTAEATHPVQDPFSDNPSAATADERYRPTTRKRAASISIGEANKHPRIQDLSLYTPASSQSSAFVSGPGEPRELICLCTKAPKVPRPRNDASQTAFILYRQHHQASVAAQHPGLANPEISKLIGEQWREQPEEVKDSWKRLAEEEKLRHQRQYPDYRYQPRRGGKNGANGKPTPGAGGDDPGRCQKCGGRFIATPRTPNTPFNMAMTPAFAKPMAAGLPQGLPGSGGGYPASGPMIHDPNSRVIETDHLTRRRSNTSTMNAEPHGRRYTQPYLGDINEDYAMMSPTAPPHKRQRYNNGPAGGYIPTSPPFAYGPQLGDSRSRGMSVSGPPLIGAGFGPGLLPRPPPQQQYVPAHMQPPPRPSISYPQAAQIQIHTGGAGPGFDESLRLPPLQTQMPNSPTMNSEVSSLTSTTPTQHTGLGIMNANAPPLPSSSRAHSLPPNQRPPWLFRLDMLRAISPPLKPPGPDISPFEMRGPIIALEGAAPSILKEVTAVVEKALSVSGECAVKTWADAEVIEPLNGETNETFDATTSDKSKQETKGFTSPVARFQSSMLKWHRTSEELVDYITHHPPPKSDQSINEVELGKPLSSKLPVAVLSTGYSLTVTDRCAASLHIADAYRPDDHWRWVATMWRGIVGPDLTIYVKQCAEDEMRVAQVVDFASSGILIVRVAESKGCVDGSGVVDEKLERRLGFEIMEWVRSGQFGRRSA
ncbi:putative HMG box domain-containing protein [Seiridium cardinale]|uniref:HMG box domain-containing protein n=1 Tax=Seiridium cardinale TaxID=138064 RepID=A0ABR2XYY8_9PEZI